MEILYIARKNLGIFPTYRCLDATVLATPYAEYTECMLLFLMGTYYYVVSIWNTISIDNYVYFGLASSIHSGKGPVKLENH